MVVAQTALLYVDSSTCVYVGIQFQVVPQALGGRSSLPASPASFVRGLSERQPILYGDTRQVIFLKYYYYLVGSDKEAYEVRK